MNEEIKMKANNNVRVDVAEIIQQIKNSVSQFIFILSCC